MLGTIHGALGSGWRWLVPIVRGLRSATRLTAVSQDLARRFKPLAGQRIDVIPTGLDLQRSTPTPRPSLPSPFTVGVVARLHAVKRLDVAVAAVRILMAQGVTCRLVIAGEGPEYQRIEALAAGLEIDFRGAVTDVPTFLRSLDAFLLPSDHEGTPAALLEAMAVGVPCIATRVGGIPALLGTAGILVPRRDPAAIASAVKRLMNNAALRDDLGAAAVRRAGSYSMEHQSHLYAELYRAIAEPLTTVMEIAHE
jgi:glycosyltransferase involved in cell wall biosynthesis